MTLTAPVSAVPGATITVSITSNSRSGQTVSLPVSGVASGSISISVSDDGTGSGTFTIPAGTPTGPLLIRDESCDTVTVQVGAMLAES